MMKKFLLSILLLVVTGFMATAQQITTAVPSTQFDKTDDGQEITATPNIFAEQAIDGSHFEVPMTDYNDTDPDSPYMPPTVLFDESPTVLTIRIYTDGQAEVYINGQYFQCEDAFIHTIPRYNSDDFHVHVQVLWNNQMFYFGYDSNYDTFATLPILYASEVERGKGLKINVNADSYDYYCLLFWPDGLEHVWPEYCDYQINGSGEWTRSAMGDTFYLPQFGDYVIQAYGVAGGNECCSSSPVTVDVHYGPDGFYSRCNTFIVYNGLRYTPNSEQDDKSLMVRLSYDDDTVENPFTLPTPSDIVIPGSLTIAGDEYTVTEVFRYFCNEPASITCLSATPINASMNYGIENDPFFEQTALFVPLEGLEAYKADPEWGLFTHIAPFVGAGPGDIDGNGQINVADVTDLIEMVLNGNFPEWGDCNGDGIINITDITDLINTILMGK